MDGLLCVNKPQNMTSFDVVAQLRKIYKTKKIGHSGTLDPNATGILVCALNSATKSLPYLNVFDKTYHTKMVFGKRTDTQDIWGTVLEEQSVPEFSIEQIRDVLTHRIGKQRQQVPQVSAKKYKGKKLYEYHREGIEIAPRYTDVEIYDIEFISYAQGVLEFKAHVSNGTYIRALVEDIAKDLGTIASMSYLDRIQLGAFDLEDAIDLEKINENTALLDPKKFYRLPLIHCEACEAAISFGQRLQLETEHDQCIVVGTKHFAVYEREKGNQFKSVRGLW